MFFWKNLPKGGYFFGFKFYINSIPNFWATFYVLGSPVENDLNVKLGAVQSTYYMVKSYRFKFPNLTVRNFRTATCGSALWPAEIARYAAEMHRSCGISAPLTAEFPHHLLRNAHGMMRARARTISGGKCARYAAEMRTIRFGIFYLYGFFVFWCWLYGSQFDIKKPDHVDWVYIHYSFSS